MSLPTTSAPKARLRWAIQYRSDGRLLEAGCLAGRSGNPCTFLTRAAARTFLRDCDAGCARVVRIEITAGWRVI